MARRSRFFPADNVTVGEWRYLVRRYPAAEAAERRARIVAALTRLRRKGHHPEQLHRALMIGIAHWDAHHQQQTTRLRARQLNADIARARKDFDRAVASLRRLAPWPAASDDEVLAMRHLLLEPVTTPPPPPTRARGGRPWEWKQAAEEALRHGRVVGADRRELIAAIGFVEDE